MWRNHVAHDEFSTRYREPSEPTLQDDPERRQTNRRSGWRIPLIWWSFRRCSPAPFPVHCYRRRGGRLVRSLRGFRVGDWRKRIATNQSRLRDIVLKTPRLFCCFSVPSSALRGPGPGTGTGVRAKARSTNWSFGWKHLLNLRKLTPHSHTVACCRLKITPSVRLVVFLC